MARSRDRRLVKSRTAVATAVALLDDDRAIALDRVHAYVDKSEMAETEPRWNR